NAAVRSVGSRWLLPSTGPRAGRTRTLSDSRLILKRPQISSRVAVASLFAGAHSRGIESAQGERYVVCQSSPRQELWNPAVSASLQGRWPLPRQPDETRPAYSARR